MADHLLVCTSWFVHVHLHVLVFVCMNVVYAYGHIIVKLCVCVIVFLCVCAEPRVQDQQLCFLSQPHAIRVLAHMFSSTEHSFCLNGLVLQECSALRRIPVDLDGWSLLLGFELIQPRTEDGPVCAKLLTGRLQHGS